VFLHGKKWLGTYKKNGDVIGFWYIEKKMDFKGVGLQRQKPLWVFGMFRIGRTLPIRQCTKGDQFNH
jgi:hypothetical protein